MTKILKMMVMCINVFDEASKNVEDDDRRYGEDDSKRYGVENGVY